MRLEEIDRLAVLRWCISAGSDEIATKLSPVRALKDAKEKGQDLVTSVPPVIT